MYEFARFHVRYPGASLRVILRTEIVVHEKPVERDAHLTTVSPDISFSIDRLAGIEVHEAQAAKPSDGERLLVCHQARVRPASNRQALEHLAATQLHDFHRLVGCQRDEHSPPVAEQRGAEHARLVDAKKAAARRGHARSERLEPSDALITEERLGAFEQRLDDRVVESQ